MRDYSILKGILLEAYPKQADYIKAYLNHDDLIISPSYRWDAIPNVAMLDITFVLLKYGVRRDFTFDSIPVTLEQAKQVMSEIMAARKK